MDSVGQREHAINRGLFQRSKIAGIEADAFVLLVLFTAGFFLPPLLNPRKMWWYALVGIAFFGINYFLLRWLFKTDPRFFVKIRHFFRWNSFFRARPSLIAERARIEKTSRKKGI
jgi:hypothetical protein